ncbi:MAG: hypothetical protein IJ181_09995, partial [Acidaminococcaceae bacterium]|nr:hypothetical protein [Acidaminococcaceae bacterium]
GVVRQTSGGRLFPDSLYFMRAEGHFLGLFFRAVLKKSLAEKWGGFCSGAVVGYSLLYWHIYARGFVSVAEVVPVVSVATLLCLFVCVCG